MRLMTVDIDHMQQRDPARVHYPGDVVILVPEVKMNARRTSEPSKPVSIQRSMTRLIADADRAWLV